jgi:hypothetical protein
MPGYAKQSITDLGGIASTTTVRNVGDSEQLLYTATKKSAVTGLIAANRSTGILPVSVYIKKTVSANVSNKALTSNVATLTTSSAHKLFTGDSVTVSGIDATFNGTYTVVSVPTTTTFTYAKVSANVASVAASGSVSTTATFYIVKDLRVNNAENKELIEKPFVITASEAIYAVSGVDDAFDMVLSIQEGVN